MNKYQFKNKTQLGIAYYYCYGDDGFENWLRIKNIKFKKLTEKMTSGKNLFNEKDKEIERLNKELNYYKKEEELYRYYQQEVPRLENIINELEKYINEEYTYDEVGMKIFDASTLQDKLKELKEGVDKE